MTGSSSSSSSGVNPYSPQWTSPTPRRRPLCCVGCTGASSTAASNAGTVAGAERRPDDLAVRRRCAAPRDAQRVHDQQATPAVAAVALAGVATAQTRLLRVAVTYGDV